MSTRTLRHSIKIQSESAGRWQRACATLSKPWMASYWFSPMLASTRTWVWQPPAVKLAVTGRGECCSLFRVLTHSGSRKRIRSASDKKWPTRRKRKKNLVLVSQTGAFHWTKSTGFCRVRKTRQVWPSLESFSVSNSNFNEFTIDKNEMSRSADAPGHPTGERLFRNWSSVRRSANMSFSAFWFRASALVPADVASLRAHVARYGFHWKFKPKNVRILVTVTPCRCFWNDDRLSIPSELFEFLHSVLVRVSAGQNCLEQPFVPLRSTGHSTDEFIGQSLLVSGAHLLTRLDFIDLLMWRWSVDGRSSVDAWLDPSIRNRPVPNWNYLLLRFQIFLLYFFAGIKKFDQEWLSGYPMKYIGKHYVFTPFR